MLPLFQAQVSTELLLEQHDRDDDDDANDNNSNKEFSDNNPLKRNALSRPERKALERAQKIQNRQQQQRTERTPSSSSSSNNNNRRRRKHNFQDRARLLNTNHLGEPSPYSLHSSAGVNVLTLQSTTPEDVMRSLKRAQNLHDAHDLRAIARFLLEQTTPTSNFAYGYRGSLLARLAVAALHLQLPTVATAALQERQRSHASSKLPLEDAAIVRGLLRTHNVTEAWDILNQDLALPVGVHWSNVTDEMKQDSALRDRIQHRVLSLASIISRHFFEGEPVRGCAACQVLAETGPYVRVLGLLDSNNNNNRNDDDSSSTTSSSSSFEMPWTRLLRGAVSCQVRIRNNELPHTWENSQLAANKVTLPCHLAYAVLHAMSAFPSNNSDRLYELLATALVRRVVFITGAINLAGCPPADRGEACFIGRSNVGKSSLINMITNRKALAYISKRPGKTQQFNFFAVNDAPDREKQVRYGDPIEGTPDPDTFYLVDLPGFGYARVPEAQRRAWLDFLHDYLETRSSIQTVFHLMDSRHGPISEDANIMQQVADILNAPESKASFQYIIVLTKADKNVKSAKSSSLSLTANRGRVSAKVMDAVRNTLQQAGLTNDRVPILVSSAETKLGRDDLWRYLRRAAEGRTFGRQN